MSPFLIRTVGGPLDGQTRFTERLEDYGLSWPLPDVLPLIPDSLCMRCLHAAHGVEPCDFEVRDHGDMDCRCAGHEPGRYVKTSESELPPEAAANPTVGVGAEFRWQAS